MSSLWRMVFFWFILGWDFLVWRSYAEQKIQWLVSAIALRQCSFFIQGSNWVIHESLSFFFRKTWICHDLSIWIQTYLEATTKQWYLYDHGNRGYHYRKIYWNLGLQKKKSGNQRLHWTMNVSIASFHLFAWCWNQKIRSSHHKSQFDDYFFHIFLFPQHFLRDICAELRWFVPQFPSGNKSPMKKIGGFPS